jgi:spermidine synthase
VGLGTGTLAAYGRPGQRFTFFELDPEVVRIAKDPAYFTYLHDSRARITTVTGDGRLGLSRTAPGSFDLIVLDAFSSDAIPVHLLTQEAIKMYAARLADGGSLVFHISNRVFDLRPVLHAAAAAMGWRALVDTSTSTTAGGMASVWVVMGPANDTIRALVDRPGWTTMGARSVAWTDDYSSVLSVLR